MVDFVKKLFTIKEIRNRILITISIIFLVKILSFVPIPGIPRDFFASRSAQLENLVQENPLLGVLSIVSGSSFGGGGNLSIALAGIFPYISASLIVQVLSGVVPYLIKLKEEPGPAGQKKLSLITKFLTIPLCYIQGYALLSYVQSQFQTPLEFSPFDYFAALTTIAAGTFITVWLGELITEFGIANGISIIVFSSSVLFFAQLVSGFNIGSLNIQNIIVYALIIAGVLAFVVASVYFSETERRVNVQYSSSTRNEERITPNNFLPIKLNQSGVIPIIMATSFAALIITIGNLFQNARTDIIRNAAQFITNNFSVNSSSYMFLVAGCIILFSYAFQNISFDPEKISTQLQKSGGYIPSVRPGEPTKNYLQKLAGGLNFFGALFLGLMFILPFVLFSFFPEVSAFQTISAISFLIVVSVGIEIYKFLKAQVDQYSYLRL